MADQTFAGPTLTPGGQPRMGSTFTAPMDDGESGVVKVVGRLYGQRIDRPRPHGGRSCNRDCCLIAVVIEHEDGFRESIDWPIKLLTDTGS